MTPPLLLGNDVIVIKFDNPLDIFWVLEHTDIKFIAAFDVSSMPSVVEACNKLDIPICDTNTKLHEGDMLRDVNSGVRYMLLSNKIPKLLHTHIIMTANTLIDIKNYAQRSFGGILWDGSKEDYEQACKETDMIILKPLDFLPESNDIDGWINFHDTQIETFK